MPPLSSKALQFMCFDLDLDLNGYVNLGHVVA